MFNGRQCMFDITPRVTLRTSHHVTITISTKISHIVRNTRANIIVVSI